MMERVLGLLESDAVDVDPLGCWRWQGYRDPDGYGHVSVDGRVWLAHRVVYTALIGPILAGYHLDHLCKVTCCVNPDHVEPVTPEDHARRNTRTHCRRGHRLTPDNVRVYYRKDKKEWQCRTCLRVAKRDQKRRRRALGLPA